MNYDSQARTIILDNAAEIYRNNYELPQLLTNLLPNEKDFLHQINWKSTAVDRAQTLFSTKLLLIEEATRVINRLEGEQFVVIDTYRTTGVSGLPLIQDLRNSNKLRLYIPATNSLAKNYFAIQQLEMNSIHNRLPKITELSEIITADISKGQIKNQIAEIRQMRHVESKCPNLVTISSGFFGNEISREQTLHNIYSSLEESDYLALFLGKYNDNEEQRVNDYRTYSQEWFDLHAFARVFNPDFRPEEFQVWWDETIHGVRVSMIVDRPFFDAGLSIPSGTRINLFRSFLLPEQEIISMLERIGFTLKEVLPASDNNSAAFICQKS